jgi:hypothetical protein
MKKNLPASGFPLSLNWSKKLEADTEVMFITAQLISYTGHFTHVTQMHCEPLMSLAPQSVFISFPNQQPVCEISGSLGDVYEHGCLLGR